MIAKNMTKSYFIFSMFIISFILCQVAQAEVYEIIENIKIVSINKIDVIPENDLMILHAQVTNRNDHNVMLSEGSFSFYIELKGEKKKLIGVDERDREILLEPVNILRGRTGLESNTVKYEISMSRDPNEQNIILSKLIRAIGSPREAYPKLYVSGDFRIGIQIEKGWTSASIEIDWKFRPVIKQFLLLEGGNKVLADHLKYLEPVRPCHDSGNPSKPCPPPEMKKEFFMLLFDYDSSKLRFEYEELSNIDNYPKFSEGKNMLDDLGLYLEKMESCRLSIIGHACSLGSKDYNKNLSEKRSDAVKAYLTNNFKIDSSRITTLGSGETKQQTSNDTPEGRALNRRVEFIISDCK